MNRVHFPGILIVIIFWKICYGQTLQNYECSCNGFVDHRGEGECLTSYPVWTGSKWCYVEPDSACNDTIVWTESNGMNYTYSYEACQHFVTKRVPKNIFFKSSSVFEKNRKKYGPHLAGDGNDTTYYKSDSEKYPTIYLVLSNAELIDNLTITTEQILPQTEITIGNEHPSRVIGKRNLFKLCGHFSHNSSVKMNHFVQCKKPFVKGDYIVIKTVEEGFHTLQINEIKVGFAKVKHSFLTRTSKFIEENPLIFLITIPILLAIVIIIQMFRRANDIEKVERYVQLLLKGDRSKINPNLSINDQINLLEYNKKYEIVYENITIGAQIGNGQFGNVFIGTTKGLFVDEETKVAIKQVKDTSNKQNLESIIGELKIMSNMGNHMNIVNFIGATTTNVVAKKINILLEYCGHGDLKKFLQRNYDDFIANLSGTEDKNDNICGPKMLFKWCHEIAKGMEYLEGKKIMHGDLAARNILLNEDYVAKISDFGLAKQLYYDKATYTKMNRRMVPWAWMGIEYLRSGEFTLKSDVWSYGILLWEIYSLGAKPYGIEPFLDVKEKLESGYRLPASERMTELDMGRNVYSSIMEKCWRAQQSQRPTFSQLVEELENMMDKEEMDNYQANIEKFNQKTQKIRARANT